MKNFKSILLIFLLTNVFVIPSCEKGSSDPLDSCHDVDFTQYQYFNIEGLNYEWRNVSSDIDTVAFEELGHLYIDYETDYSASLQPKTKSSFSLIPTAYACSIIPGTKGSKEEELISFTISTLNDFDEEHTANSNINDLFDYQGGFLDFPENPIPLTQYLEEQTGLLQEEDMVLTLKKAPEINTEFKIKVVMELSTNEVYEFETEPIFIVP